ncbi:MAG TPA: glycoside hydrolase family 3 N-terminal domain-containing protein, partial [Anaerolineales bacterium]|nr:glycoside hydrolase family 3 N-terminal domain-containing protein [Anaerolineales bacterium]
QAQANDAALAVDGRFIPLLVGVDYESQADFPSGVDPNTVTTPNLMAFGATWKPEHAKNAAELVAKQLDALGINLLLGPTADLAYPPRTTSPSDAGAGVFGEDPYWTARFVKAYTAGIQNGSAGRVAVMLRHFPGIGAADRSNELNRATVAKTLDELLAVDLKVFDGLSGIAGQAGVASGVLVAHVRFPALQSNTATDLRPLSVDTQALPALFKRAPFADWRNSGGVAMSLPLGALSIRNFYDSSGVSFPSFNIARDALLAGNDLLFLDEFFAPNETQSQTVAKTIDQFVRKYKEDTVFASSIDAAVLRILTMKYKQFGEMTLDSALPKPVAVDINAATTLNLTVATESASLISPSAEVLAGRIQRAPAENDRLVFLTDTMTANVCADCLPSTLLPTNALEQVVVRLYGAAGSGEIQSNLLSSYSFTELSAFLDGQDAVDAPTDEPANPKKAIGDALRQANWLVIVVGKLDAETRSQNALVRLLAERSDLLQEKKVIVFSVDAPYYLGASEISQITAYYGLYSWNPAFLQVAANLLFQEFTASGKPPVSIDAVSYNLTNQLQADTSKPFDIFIDESVQSLQLTPEITNSPEATAPLAVPEGQTLSLFTSLLLDKNGHVLKDGSEVRFEVTYLSQSGLTQTVFTNSVDGVARVQIPTRQTGLVEVVAFAGEAISNLQQYDIRGETIIPILPTATPQPTSTETPIPTPTATATINPAGGDSTPTFGVNQATVDIGDLLATAFITLALSSLAWRLSDSRQQPISRGVKMVLLVWIGVWLSYNYYALNGPGVAEMAEINAWAPILFATVGGVLGLLLGFVFFARNAGDGQW